MSNVSGYRSFKTYEALSLSSSVALKPLQIYFTILRYPEYHSTISLSELELFSLGITITIFITELLDSLLSLRITNPFFF